MDHFLTQETCRLCVSLTVATAGKRQSARTKTARPRRRNPTGLCSGFRDERACECACASLEDSVSLSQAAGPERFVDFRLPSPRILRLPPDEN